MFIYTSFTKITFADLCNPIIFYHTMICMDIGGCKQNIKKTCYDFLYKL